MPRTSTLTKLNIKVDKNLKQADVPVQAATPTGGDPAQ